MSTEKFVDLMFLADQLVNFINCYNENSFAKQVKAKTEFEEDFLRFVFQQYMHINLEERSKIKLEDLYFWEKWLNTQELEWEVQQWSEFSF